MSRMRARAVVQRHRLLRAAIHRVHEVELGDAVVVLGARLGVHLVDREHFRVAARLGEPHRRRTVRQHVDRVVERAGEHFPVRALELDFIEAGFVDAEHRASSEPSLVGTSLSVSPPSITTRPPRGRDRSSVTRMRTIVPLSAAMSPVLSTSCGSAACTPDSGTARSIVFTYGRFATSIRVRRSSARRSTSTAYSVLPPMSNSRNE